MPKSTTNITVRMDTELKKQAESLFEEFGMNMTTAFNIFVKTVVRQGKIPFEIAIDVPNTETVQAMEDVNNHRNISRSFDDVDALMRDLNA
jgi:DNA-damage-inducible protein J